MPQMLTQPNRFMVLLIDCDGDENRLGDARSAIPSNLTSRVFILGALTEPERLKSDLGGYERIGAGMATDCRNGTDLIWGHPLLRHNAKEVARLRECVRPILFGID